MSPVAASLEYLKVPDRFEGLSDAGSGALRLIITPVRETLEVIDKRFEDLRAAGRGGLMILRGDTGAGKSTFLNTVGLFRHDVVTERITGDEDVPGVLAETEPTSVPRIIVLEGREALGEVSRASLEAAMHGINSFVRSNAGRDTLVVWPTNTDDLTLDLAQ
jgi:DNA (cytosine-5)-methyltransferase 1